MQSAKTNKIVKECPKCQGAGWLSSVDHPCPDCHGMGYFEEVRGTKITIDKKMRGMPSLVRQSFNRLVVAVEAVIFIISSLFIIFGFFNLFDSLRTHASLALDMNLFFDIFFAGITTAPLWLGIILALILYFNRFVYNQPELIGPDNPYYKYILCESPSLDLKKEKIDISRSLAPQTVAILRKALDTAYSQNQKPHPLHLLFALLTGSEIYEIFVKLELSPKDFIKEAAQCFTAVKPATSTIALDALYKKYVVKSFWEAVKVDDSLIKPEHLLFVLIKKRKLKSVLNGFGVQPDDFHNIILWLKYRKVQGDNFLTKGSFKKPPHHIMNRAWSAVVTKNLDNFSIDITDYARVGWLLPLVNRENEMRMLIQILERGSRNNALLIGEEGSGRDAIVRGLARKMVRGKVPPTLIDKRLVKLDIAALGSGVGTDGSLLKRRLEVIMGEVVHTPNVIIYIPDIHELAKVNAYASMDIVSFLAPLFAKSVIQVIGSTNPADYHDHIEPRGDFSQTFASVKVNELSKEDSLKVLSIEVPFLERKSGVIITYRAAEEAIKLSYQFITDSLLPQKAIDVLAEAAVRAKNTKGQSLVTEAEVEEVFSEKTGIPVTKINKNEAQGLLELENNLAAQVIGQDKAVKSVAKAIRRVRVRIGEDERPIAVFMFLGPTGVGKTELAKALASIYFGSRDKMIRVDMSEFSTPYDIERLIGSSSGNIPGILTEAVRKNPFSLLLLDEFEKAHHDIWDLFLQIFDDGRLTDGKGRLINFTNTIIIATSNVGSKYILEGLQQGVSLSEIDPIIKEELLKIFRPEFINRFDDLITFNALTHENIKAIASIEINRLNERLEEEQGLSIKLTEEAMDYLAQIGHSPEYGARFLKRAIRERVEDVVVMGILKGAYPRGSEAVIDRQMLEAETV